MVDMRNHKLRWPDLPSRCPTYRPDFLHAISPPSPLRVHDQPLQSCCIKTRMICELTYMHHTQGSGGKSVSACAMMDFVDGFQVGC